jgi:hypothetical protein
MRLLRQHSAVTGSAVTGRWIQSWPLPMWPLRVAVCLTVLVPLILVVAARTPSTAVGAQETVASLPVAPATTPPPFSDGQAAYGLQQGVAVPNRHEQYHQMAKGK